MTLEEYCTLNSITPSNLAKKFNINPLYFYRYIKGMRKPTFDMMEKIRVITDNAVCANDWVHNTKIIIKNHNNQNNSTEQKYNGEDK